MEFLSKALTDTTTFNQVLKKSYRHNNGFHKLVMDELPDETKIRLHFYEAGGQESSQPKEHIHDHRWAFTSTILAGQLYMDRFEWCDDPTEQDAALYDAYEYCADKSSGRFGLRCIGKRWLRFVEECVFRKGESYCMAPQELHRIHGQHHCSTLHTITLMTTHPPVSSTCHLFADPTQGHQAPTPDTQTIVPYHPHELNALLHTIRNIIAMAE